VDQLEKDLIAAHKGSFRRAFETAVRTGTCLIFMRDGKLVRVKPPYRYKLVRVRRRKKRKRSST